MTRRRVLGAFLVAGVGGAFACSTFDATGVSESGPDSGDEASSQDANATDAPSEVNADAGGDAAEASSPPCDPAKPFGAAALVPGINSAFDNTYDVRLTADELTVYFTGSRAGVTAAYDLYTATRSAIGDPFANLTALSALNSTSNDTALSVNASGTIAYFASDRAGAQHIYTATRANTGFPFGSVTLVSGIPFAAAITCCGFLQPDDVLWFTSNQGGTYAIYTTTLPPAPDGGSVVARADLNTAAGDFRPVLSVDGLTIYFKSRRATDTGLGDIWMATRPSTTAMFTTPTKVTELATTTEDFPTWLSVDGCTLYFSNSSSGTYKAYQARRPR